MSGGYDVRVACIPGHMEVIGNEDADALARIAESRADVDIQLPKTLRDCYHIIEKHIINEWQIQWDGAPVSLHYHVVQPVVDRKCKSSR